MARWTILHSKSVGIKIVHVKLWWVGCELHAQVAISLSPNFVLYSTVGAGYQDGCSSSINNSACMQLIITLCG